MLSVRENKLDEMSFHIAKLARLRRRVADHWLSAYGLSEATMHPLSLLAKRGAPMGQSELAEEMGIEGPSLVRLIDLLEKEGLVERREHPTDRRAKLLFLTAKGKAKTEKIGRVVNAGRTDLFREISTEELAATLNVLHRVEESCKRILQQPVPSAARKRSAAKALS